MFLLYGCSILGFVELDLYDKSNTKTIEVEFVYQPLIGGKHNVFITGDFNNWSESSLRMHEDDGLYKIVLNLEPGKYGY